MKKGSARCFGTGTGLSELLLQGPISAFIGTFRIGAKYEDVPIAENLGCGTLIRPVSGARLPTAREMPREGSGLIIFGATWRGL